MRGGRGIGGAALLGIGCCAGLPLLVAAGLGAAAYALTGGIAAAAIGLAGGIVLIAARRRTATSPTPLHDLKELDVQAQDCCAPVRTEHEATVTRQETDGSGPLVEVLYFGGCPNHEKAAEVAERIAAELGLRPQLRLVNVADPEAAERLRFLGSPTVRVGGRDVEPGADERTDYALSCRVFRTERGFSGQPDEHWIRDALLRETRFTSTEVTAS